MRVRSLLWLAIGAAFGVLLARLLDPDHGAERRRELARKGVRELGRSIPRLRRLIVLAAEIGRSLAAGYRESDDPDGRLRPVA
jgi:hypothetical protein